MSSLGGPTLKKKKSLGLVDISSGLQSQTKDILVIKLFINHILCSNCHVLTCSYSPIIIPVFYDLHLPHCRIQAFRNRLKMGPRFAGFCILICNQRQPSLIEVHILGLPKDYRCYGNGRGSFMRLTYNNNKKKLSALNLSFLVHP